MFNISNLLQKEGIIYHKKSVFKSAKCLRKKNIKLSDVDYKSEKDKS